MLAASLPRRYAHLAPWLAALAVLAGLALTIFALSHQSWTMSDGRAYQLAGERLRNGEPLYPATYAESGPVTYRYAPWFAYLWVLPIPEWLWLGSMAACSVLAVLPSLRAGWLGVGFGVLMFPYLLIAAMGGHVQPAIICLLVYAVPTRWGPLAIAVAASLKGFPLLYVLVYIGRREWWNAAIAVGVTAILVAPMLLFDLSGYGYGPAIEWGLFLWSPILWGVVCLGLAAWVLYRPTWLAGSLLVVLSIPRFVYYDVSYLLVGLRDPLQGEPRPDVDAVAADRDDRSVVGIDQHGDGIVSGE